ncbi:hypothetical protein A4X13_0g6797 [Tilletia indica]|uniref:Uncharacterized protein n=1 Tax=Tilletia indica TaxID=43049 RepID=A0A177TIB8_9BASI|nr:hypothetical protein A4X13_0g6797 [Tilletia indica]
MHSSNPHLAATAAALEAASSQRRRQSFTPSLSHPNRLSHSAASSLAPESITAGTRGTISKPVSELGNDLVPIRIIEASDSGTTREGTVYDDDDDDDDDDDNNEDQQERQHQHQHHNGSSNVGHIADQDEEDGGGNEDDDDGDTVEEENYQRVLEMPLARNRKTMMSYMTEASDIRLEREKDEFLEWKQLEAKRSEAFERARLKQRERERIRADELRRDELMRKLMAEQGVEDVNRAGAGSRIAYGDELSRAGAGSRVAHTIGDDLSRAGAGSRIAYTIGDRSLPPLPPPATPLPEVPLPPTPQLLVNPHKLKAKGWVVSGDPGPSSPLGHGGGSSVGHSSSTHVNPTSSAGHNGSYFGSNAHSSGSGLPQGQTRPRRSSSTPSTYDNEQSSLRLGYASNSGRGSGDHQRQGTGTHANSALPPLPPLVPLPPLPPSPVPGSSAGQRASLPPPPLPAKTPPVHVPITKDLHTSALPPLPEEVARYKAIAQHARDQQVKLEEEVRKSEWKARDRAEKEAIARAKWAKEQATRDRLDAWERSLLESAERNRRETVERLRQEETRRADEARLESERQAIQEQEALAEAARRRDLAHERENRIKKEYELRRAGDEEALNRAAQREAARLKLKKRLEELELGKSMVLNGSITVQLGDSLIWRRRWFELRGNSMLLYKSEHEKADVLERIDLRGSIRSVTDAYEECQMVNSFKVTFVDDAPFSSITAYTDTPEDKDVLRSGIEVVSSIEL